MVHSPSFNLIETRSPPRNNWQFHISQIVIITFASSDLHLTKMLLSLLTLFLSFFASSILAQSTLIPSSLPQCGQTCPLLITAQNGCVPPAAPVTNSAIYQSCFCLSDFLKPLHAGGSTTVCPACSTQDIGTIENWFQKLCASPNQGSTNQAPPTDQTPPDQTPPDQTPPDQQPPDAQPATPNGSGSTAKGAPISENPPPDNRGWSVSRRLIVVGC